MKNDAAFYLCRLRSLELLFPCRILSLPPQFQITLENLTVLVLDCNRLFIWLLWIGIFKICAPALLAFNDWRSPATTPSLSTARRIVFDRYWKRAANIEVNIEVASKKLLSNENLSNTEKTSLASNSSTKSHGVSGYFKRKGLSLLGDNNGQKVSYVFKILLTVAWRCEKHVMSKKSQEREASSADSLKAHSRVRKRPRSECKCQTTRWISRFRWMNQEKIVSERSDPRSSPGDKRSGIDCRRKRKWSLFRLMSRIPSLVR